jgi:hypothetical protein
MRPRRRMRRSIRLPEGYCLFLALALLFELIALKFACCAKQHCLWRRYADLSSVHWPTTAKAFRLT